jgi:uncharacterized protein YijF (DUF1287 family)
MAGSSAGRLTPDDTPIAMALLRAGRAQMDEVITVYDAGKILSTAPRGSTGLCRSIVPDQAAFQSRDVRLQGLVDEDVYLRSTDVVSVEFSLP